MRFACASLMTLAMVVTSSAGAGGGRSADGWLEEATVQVAAVVSSAEGKTALVRKGSGFAMGRECVVFTAAHVVDAAGDSPLAVVANLNHRGMRQWPASLLFADPQRDVAALTLHPLRNCPPVKLPDVCRAPRTLSRNKILMMGYPNLTPEWNLRTPLSKEGIVSQDAFNHKELGQLYLLDVDGGPGYSGGPVMDLASEEVIAVVHGPRGIARERGFEFASPISQADYDVAADAIAGLREREPELPDVAAPGTQSQDLDAATPLVPEEVVESLCAVR